MTAAEIVALAAATPLAVIEGSAAHWDLSLFAMLLVFSVVSDLLAVDTAASKLKISGSFLALVLAMVFLGAAPAVLIGVTTIVVGWLRWRYAAHILLINLVTYAWFPLIGGQVFHSVSEAARLDSSDGFFYLLLFGVYQISLAVNFAAIAGYFSYIEETSIVQKARKVLPPVLPSELSAALLAVGLAYLYHRIGLAAIVFFGIVLFTFQYLLGQLMVSEERGEELRLRTRQLASLQVGLLSALLHTLDLRDRMTARHSAAVARYAKEIAQAAGYQEEDQDLVHTAGLLHDIGKFIFPDRILKGDVELTEQDWQIIRMHPYQGARIVSQVQGYGPVGDIILAHHERLDGKGYPRHLKGDQIPALSRMISVADIYDVMTARDSYRTAVSSFEAIRELRRVSGTQLDAHFVEVFIQVLAGKDVRYRHGEDADFDAELALDKRVHDYASPAVLAEALAPSGNAAADGSGPEGREVEPERGRGRWMGRSGSVRRRATREEPVKEKTPHAG